MELYLRNASLTVEDQEFKTRIAFQIEKTKFGESANNLQIQAYNLSERSRNFVEDTTSKKVRQMLLKTGYRDRLFQTFFGDIFYAWSERKGPDIITTFQAIAGLRFIQRSVVVSNGVGSDWDALQLVLVELKKEGIYQGSITVEAQAALKTGVYQKPQALCEPAFRTLRRITTNHKLHWSVDYGLLNVYGVKPFKNQAILLTEDTGMIGLPSKLNFVGYRVKSLLNPLIEPGSLIQVKSKFLNLPALLEVWTVKHNGDTLEGPWESELEMCEVGKELDGLSTDEP